MPREDICAEYTKCFSAATVKFVVSLVDKCACVRYNVSTFNRRYWVMFAFSTAKTGYCTFSAAADTSARNLANLDTARVVVSILLSPSICQLQT